MRGREQGMLVYGHDLVALQGERANVPGCELKCRRGDTRKKLPRGRERLRARCVERCVSKRSAEVQVAGALPAHIIASNNASAAVPHATAHTHTKKKEGNRNKKRRNGVSNPVR